MDKFFAHKLVRGRRRATVEPESRLMQTLNS